MINFQERKKTLSQDINAQQAEIRRIETALKEAEVLLARLEGAALLCDEFTAQQAKEQQATQ
jgi:hypothetical protein